MKILHCCLAAFYIDNYAYQENVLPKIHKLDGHDVEILASTETYIENTNLGYVNPSTYESSDHITVTRIPYVKFIPHIVSKKLRIYKGVRNKLNTFLPDIIFLHDCQFLSIVEIVKYKKKHPKVKIFVDCHTDFINSGKNWVSKNILHKIIYKWCAKKVEPYTEKFYGTLPIRVDFLNNVYGISKSKLELLVLGLDDTQIDFTQRKSIRNTIRKELQLDEMEFVIVTGGKLDFRKNIHILMKVVSELETNIKLIVFGTPNKEMKTKIEILSKGKNIIYIGWLSPEKLNDYFFAADLAFFPGTHSVLWEQAVGLGLPCVFKKWEGIQHVDLKGNCMFIEEGSSKEIKEIITKIHEDKSLYSSMKKTALDKGIKEFSYTDIARRAIDINR
jgi:glycosyltransferase involved in cell wall biosynthesis